jgi:hypothetical protein
MVAAGKILEDEYDGCRIIEADRPNPSLGAPLPLSGGS